MKAGILMLFLGGLQIVRPKRKPLLATSNINFQPKTRNRNELTEKHSSINKLGINGLQVFMESPPPTVSYSNV